MPDKRNTRQRQMVLDAVRARCDHPTADDIYLDVRGVDSKISRGTVYRNLGVLAETGEITHVRSFPADRYDLRLDRHYHMRCIHCGRVWDAPVEYQQAHDAQLEAATGFRVACHDTIFEVECPDCRPSGRPANRKKDRSRQR